MEKFIKVDRGASDRFNSVLWRKW